MSSQQRQSLQPQYINIVPSSQQQQQQKRKRQQALRYGKSGWLRKALTNKNPQLQSRYKQIKQQQRRANAQPSRQYMRKVLQKAEELGEPIEFTLKFKKFLGDLTAASLSGLGAGIGVTDTSRAMSRIIFSVGAVDENNLPAILEGRLTRRPYTQLQKPLAVSDDDDSNRLLIKFTIRPMNAKEVQQFTKKRQQKAKGSMSKFLNQPVKSTKQKIAQTGRSVEAGVGKAAQTARKGYQWAKSKLPFKF